MPGEPRGRGKFPRRRLSLGAAPRSPSPAGTGARVSACVRDTLALRHQRVLQPGMIPDTRGQHERHKQRVSEPYIITSMPIVCLYYLCGAV